MGRLDRRHPVARVPILTGGRLLVVAMLTVAFHAHAESPRRVRPAAQDSAQTDSDPQPDRPAARGGDRRRNGGAPPLWDRLDDEGRRRLRAFLQEHFPEMFAEVEWLEVNRPRQAINRLRRLAPELARFRELMKRDPEQARLAIQERRIDLQIVVRVRDYWGSDSEVDRAALRAEITELMEKLFDVRLQRRRLEVDQLRDRLEGLERRLEHAEKNRDSIIERQISEKLDHRPMPDRRRNNDRVTDEAPNSDEP